MRDVVLEHAPRDKAVAVLDLGCGTGSLIFLLADALPEARVIGIDVSAANIAEAERSRVMLDPVKAGRIVFESKNIFCVLDFFHWSRWDNDRGFWVSFFTMLLDCCKFLKS